MLTAKSSRIIAPGNRAADSLHLVGGDGLTISGTANHDALIGFTIGHLLGSRNAPEGIVGGIGRVGSHIDHLVTLCAEHFGQGLLVFKTCVVTANGDLHECLVDMVLR